MDAVDISRSYPKAITQREDLPLTPLAEAFIQDLPFTLVNLLLLVLIITRSYE